MRGEGVMWYTARVGPTVTIILHITVHSAAVVVHYEGLQVDSCSDNTKSYSCINGCDLLHVYQEVHEHVYCKLSMLS